MSQPIDVDGAGLDRVGRMIEQIGVGLPGGAPCPVWGSSRTRAASDALLDELAGGGRGLAASVQHLADAVQAARTRLAAADAGLAAAVTSGASAGRMTAR